MTWHVERERINARGELEYYDAWRTSAGWNVALAQFEATLPLPGERIYLSYSDNEQATILRWNGELAIGTKQ